VTDSANQIREGASEEAKEAYGGRSGWRNLGVKTKHGLGVARQTGSSPAA
jgi:hypothetical protein